MGPLRRPATGAVALLLGGSLSLVGCTGAPPAPEPLTMLAPEHLAPLVDPIAQLWHSSGGPPLRIRYDSPERVARQVDSGTPATLVVTGDGSWMDRLQRGGHLLEADRCALALDELVVVDRPGRGAPPVEGGTSGEGHQRLRSLQGPVQIPWDDRPPGTAIQRLLAGSPRSSEAPPEVVELDEATLVARLPPGSAAVVRESALIGGPPDLRRYPVRGRLDLASTIEVARLTEAPELAARFVDWVSTDPSVLAHVLALDLGMPNPRRQPAGRPPAVGPPGPAEAQPIPAR